MTLLGRWHEAARRRDTLRALYGLDAHTLRDIGIGNERRHRQIDRKLRDTLICRV